MATTYLELVNAINNRFNEVALTSANFAGAIGHYAQVKDAVNIAIHEICNEQIEWPFLRITTSQTLTQYQTRYPYPADCKYLDIESFRLRYSAALSVDARRLVPISYDEYLQQYSIQESSPNESFNGVPNAVFTNNNSEWGVTPKPMAAYVIDYEYTARAVDLVNHNDEMIVPDTYKYVVLAGAEYYVHVFRDNPESADRAKEYFKAGIKTMRKILINRNDNVRSTMLPQVGRLSERYI